MRSARLREVFDYNPETGVIKRKISLPTGNGRLDSPVGTTTKGGYLCIVLDGIKIWGHHFVWLYVYDTLPDSIIYFKDGDRANLKLSNLSLDKKDKPKYAKGSIRERLDKEGLTQELLREMFDYDPLTGSLTRKIGRSGKGGAKGTVVNGLNDKGYIYVKVGRRSYPAHRIIWIWYHGYNPENPLDHISRDRLDNSIANLREVSYQCNARNRAVRKDSTTGITGISWSGRQNQWHVTICKDVGEGKFICYVDDFTEAVAHRLAAEDCLGWNSCDNNSSAYQYMQKYLKGEL